MNIAQIAKLVLVSALVLAVVLMLEATGSAQCSMCRASLAGSNNAFFIRNFNIAVLVLLTPPVTIFCSIFIVLKRHTAQDDNAADSDRPES